MADEDTNAQQAPRLAASDWIEPAECAGATLQDYIRRRVLPEDKVRHLVQAFSVLSGAPVRLELIAGDHALLHVRDAKALIFESAVGRDSHFHKQHGYYAVVREAEGNGRSSPK